MDYFKPLLEKACAMRTDRIEIGTMLRFLVDREQELAPIKDVWLCALTSLFLGKHFNDFMKSTGDGELVARIRGIIQENYA